MVAKVNIFRFLGSPRNEEVWVEVVLCNVDHAVIGAESVRKALLSCYSCNFIMEDVLGAKSCYARRGNPLKRFAKEYIGSGLREIL